MIKAVIFDMDGLLIDSEPLWLQACTEVLAPLGIKWSKEVQQRHMGQRSTEVVEQMFHEHPWEGPTEDEVVEDMHRKVAALVRAEGKLKPGALQTITFCKDKGLPLAIASSSPHIVIDAVLDTLDLRQHFYHIQSAQHEPYGKPHPAVFIAAADQLDVRAQNCLVFEDAPSGVLAAKAAKMKCIAVPEPEVKRHASIQTADLILDSLEDFDEATLASL